MLNELSLAIEQIEKQTIKDRLQLHEHVYGWFLIKLESKIKRFILDQERFRTDEWRKLYEQR